MELQIKALHSFLCAQKLDPVHEQAHNRHGRQEKGLKPGISVASVPAGALYSRMYEEMQAGIHC